MAKASRKPSETELEMMAVSDPSKLESLNPSPTLERPTNQEQNDATIESLKKKTLETIAGKQTALGKQLHESLAMGRDANANETETEALVSAGETAEAEAAARKAQLEAQERGIIDFLAKLDATPAPETKTQPGAALEADFASLEFQPGEAATAANKILGLTAESAQPEAVPILDLEPITETAVQPAAGAVKAKVPAEQSADALEITADAPNKLPPLSSGERRKIALENLEEPALQAIRDGLNPDAAPKNSTLEAAATADDQKTPEEIAISNARHQAEIAKASHAGREAEDDREYDELVGPELMKTEEEIAAARPKPEAAPDTAAAVSGFELSPAAQKAVRKKIEKYRPGSRMASDNLLANLEEARAKLRVPDNNAPEVIENLRKVTDEMVAPLSERDANTAEDLTRLPNQEELAEIERLAAAKNTGKAPKSTKAPKKFSAKDYAQGFVDNVAARNGFDAGEVGRRTKELAVDAGKKAAIIAEGAALMGGWVIGKGGWLTGKFLEKAWHGVKEGGKITGRVFNEYVGDPMRVGTHNFFIDRARLSTAELENEALNTEARINKTKRQILAEQEAIVKKRQKNEGVIDPKEFRIRTEAILRLEKEQRALESAHDGVRSKLLNQQNTLDRYYEARSKTCERIVKRYDEILEPTEAALDSLSLKREQAILKRNEAEAVRDELLAQKEDLRLAGQQESADWKLNEEELATHEKEIGLIDSELYRYEHGWLQLGNSGGFGGMQRHEMIANAYKDVRDRYVREGNTREPLLDAEAQMHTRPKLGKGRTARVATNKRSLAPATPTSTDKLSLIEVYVGAIDSLESRPEKKAKKVDTEELIRFWNQYRATTNPESLLSKRVLREAVEESLNDPANPDAKPFKVAKKMTVAGFIKLLEVYNAKVWSKKPELGGTSEQFTDAAEKGALIKTFRDNFS